MKEVGELFLSQLVHDVGAFLGKGFNGQERRDNLMVLGICFEFAVIKAKAIRPLLNPKGFHLLFDETYFVLIALIRIELQQHLVELIGVMGLQIGAIKGVEGHAVSMGVRHNHAVVQYKIVVRCGHFHIIGHLRLFKLDRDNLF